MRDYQAYQTELKKHLSGLRKAIPETMQGFSGLNQAALTDGAVSKKTKELIALSIAVAIRCEGCIAFHAEAALNAGNSRQEIAEALGVAILMGGGPSMVYGCEVLKSLDDFTTQKS